VAAVAVIERTGRTWAWVAFAVLGSLLVHLHYYAFFALLTLGLYLLVWAWRHDRRSIVKLAACAVVVALAFAPWLPVFRWQLSQGTNRSAETWWQHLALLPLFASAGRTLVWKEAGVGVVAGVDLAVVAVVFAPLGWALFTFRETPARGSVGLLIAWVVGLPAVAALVSVLKSPMIHSHYLSVILPGLALLMAVALDAAWRQGPRWAALLPAAGLAVLTVASLGRMVLVPHKTDWRGLAAVVAREGGDLPAYFYEDIGADPFGYYRPEQPARRLIHPFGEDGAAWSAEREQMRADAGGFWLVLYLTSPATRDEEGRIVGWLRRDFVIERDEALGPLRALRCRPRGGEGRP
jgi:hypothetical protein